VRSSAGAGHSIVHFVSDAQAAWQGAAQGEWLSSDDDADLEPRVIVEEYVPFEAELVVFVVRSRQPSGEEQLTVCPPIQMTDDAGFAAAWQPPNASIEVLDRAVELAQAAVSAFPGLGVFAVELFVKGDDVLVSEVTPRLASAGFVTLESQDASIFAMEARAILGLPVFEPTVITPAATRALWVEGPGKPVLTMLDAALTVPTSRVLLYGKPKATRRRSVGMVLASGPDAEVARQRADSAAASLNIALDDGRLMDSE
jgi:phosphoribosylglycinamide formyltransferase 2